MALLIHQIAMALLRAERWFLTEQDAILVTKPRYRRKGSLS